MNGTNNVRPMRVPLYAASCRREDVQEMILTRNQERCRDCFYLVEGYSSKWICDDCGKNIEDIPDDECSANQKF